MRRLIAPAIAAALCTQFVSSALPKYPLSLPWSPWAGFVALGIAFMAFLLLHVLVVWAVQKAAAIRQFLIRIPLLVALFLVFFLATLVAPIAPMFGIIVVCHLDTLCGANMQGIVNILSNMSTAAPGHLVALVCVLLIGFVAATSSHVSPNGALQ